MNDVFRYFGSDALNGSARYSNGYKRNPAKQKPSCNQDCRIGHCKTLLSPPQKVSGFPSLPMLARAPQGEQCSFRGWNSLSPYSLWVGDRAATGTVPRGASRPCFQWPPALERSFQCLTFVSCSCLCSSYHNTGSTNIPITKMLTTNHLDQMGGSGFAVLDLFV